MKIIKRIVIIIGVILYANLIIHSSPYKCVCAQKESSLCLIRDDCQYSLLGKELKKITDAHLVHVTGAVSILKKQIFDISKFSFANANVPVYHWQLPRGNIISPRTVYLGMLYSIIQT